MTERKIPTHMYGNLRDPATGWPAPYVNAWSSEMVDTGWVISRFEGRPAFTMPYSPDVEARPGREPGMTGKNGGGVQPYPPLICAIHTRFTLSPEASWATVVLAERVGPPARQVIGGVLADVAHDAQRQRLLTDLAATVGGRWSVSAPSPTNPYS